MIILHNGIARTQGEPEQAEAVAIGRDGRIIAVGSDSDVLNLANADTRKIDLRGRTLIPGFFDCHLHLLWLGTNLGHVNLASPPVRDTDDIIRLLRERLAVNPNTTCLQGHGYDQNKLAGGEHPTRHDLDRVATHIPVRIVHMSGHAAVVNSKALELLEFAKNTHDPMGGEIIRDESGEPNGVLLETASWIRLDRILPPQTPTDAIAALGRASQYLLERGITSASDANTLPEQIAWFGQATAQKELRIRVNGMVGWKEVMQSLSDGGTVPTPDDLQTTEPGVTWHDFHVGQAKLFSDGALTTRTAWLTEPFAGTPNNSGMALHSPEKLREYIIAAHNAGWQIATHAIGDRAIDAVLTAYAEAQRLNTRHRPGHRIEHAMLLNFDMIARLRRQNVWSIGQPEFLSRLGDAYVTALGEERANRLSPYATLDAQNVAQAFSSDCPVVPGSPLDGIRAAIERKTASGRILNERERLPIETALYNYTAAPAYATRTERDRGTIEIGKWADFTLLSADPLTTPLDDWEQIAVEATFIGGECRHDRNEEF